MAVVEACCQPARGQPSPTLFVVLELTLSATLRPSAAASPAQPGAARTPIAHWAMRDARPLAAAPLPFHGLPLRAQSTRPPDLQRKPFLSQKCLGVSKKHTNELKVSIIFKMKGKPECLLDLFVIINRVIHTCCYLYNTAEFFPWNPKLPLPL